MTDETGLAAALEVKDRALKAGEPPDFDALADTALAWVDARLTDPAAVEAVAWGLHEQWFHEDGECLSLRGCSTDMTSRADAEAALAVVRGRLGGTGGEGA